MDFKKYINQNVLAIQLKSSTLIEVLISVTICLIIISISFQIILKSELENTLYFKLKAELNFENLCEDIVQNIEINNSNLKTGTFDAQNYILNYTIQSYSTYEGLYIINYDCYSKNNKVLFTKKMISDQ